ncbi:hypothetical protein EVAR_32853_1 [Eumeta japonica]|uniref:Histone-lysine N-methyltransferase SETMAR n=1 Tax=Eumeta variegata TaxID=151549 RepID=A0A4C1WBL4_EUMVA|nr:hypothetical protein EVAR_32853_1 [Eumeta japonica]
MDLTRENYRATIYYHFRRGLTQNSASINSLRHLEMKHHRKPLRMPTNKFRGGRPKSVVPQIIDAVRELIMQDHHVTYRKIKASLDISTTSIHKILHENSAAKIG